MSKQELIVYLKEYFDELMENGEAIDYEDCCRQILSKVTEVKIFENHHLLGG